MQFRPGPAANAAYVARSDRATRTIRVGVACAAIGLAGLAVAGIAAVAMAMLPAAATIAGVVAWTSGMTGGAMVVGGGFVYNTTRWDMRKYEVRHRIQPGLFERIQDGSMKRDGADLRSHAVLN